MPGQARRLVALATIYDGGSRSDAAKLGGVGLYGSGLGADAQRRRPIRADRPQGARANLEAVGHFYHAWNEPLDQPWKIMSIGISRWAHHHKLPDFV